MAAPTRSANYNSLGVSAGPDSTVLVDAGGYTAAAQIEFAILGPAESVEITTNFVKTGVAPSLTVTIQAFDDAAQAWITLLAGTAIVATGVQNLLVGPYAPNVANVSAAHVLRQRMRVDLAVANTDVGTYSISANAL